MRKAPSCSRARAPCMTSVLKTYVLLAHSATQRPHARGAQAAKPISSFDAGALLHSFLFWFFPQPKYLRADVKQGGWILRRVADAPSSRTLLTFVASSDLKGSLPPIIRRGLAQKQPGQVALVKPVLKARLKEIDKMEQATKEKTMLALQARIANLPVSCKPRDGTLPAAEPCVLRMLTSACFLFDCLRCAVFKTDLHGRATRRRVGQAQRGAITRQLQPLRRRGLHPTHSVAKTAASRRV
jgi:hypothetical protein